MKKQKQAYQKGERSKHPLTHLLESYAVFWKHIVHLPKLFLVDFLFFTGFVLITNFFLMDLGLIEKVMEIQQIISQLDAEALAADSLGAEGIQRLLSQKEALTQNFNTVIVLTALLILSFYVLWVILQSISLHLTHKVVHEKKHRTTFSQYLFRFSVINLVWLGIAAAGTALIIKLAMTTASSHLPLFRTPSTLLFKILLLALGYLSLTNLREGTIFLTCSEGCSLSLSRTQALSCPSTSPIS